MKNVNAKSDSFTHKTTLVTRSYIGGKDLFMGVPNLNGAQVLDTETKEVNGEYQTSIDMKLADGGLFVLVVRQEA